jgi:hypothetical protein
MKTRFLFLAAMLLMSANIFAQSISKGDVNEDGKVDVADVVAVISIMQQGGGVAILPSSVEFDKSEYGVGIDKELKLKATVLPSYATDKSLTWTSSNPGVATVSQDGVVKGIAEGSTTITVSTANGIQSTCIVNVSTVIYYWYAGWTIPTAENISTIINEEYPTRSTDPTLHKAGGSSTTNTGYSLSNPFGGMSGTNQNRYNANAKVVYYVVVPNNMAIYDPEDGSSIMSTFTLYGEFENHIIYAYKGTSRNINNIYIY